MSKQYRRQHLVSRALLDRFSENGHVAVYDKVEDRNFRLASRKAAVVKNFIEDEAAAVALESSWSAEIESRLPEALAAVENEELYRY
jgi:hypothetical protein